MNKLDSGQVKVLGELEKLVGNPISQNKIDEVDKIFGSTLKTGVYIENNKITMLALLNKYFEDFPEVICNLKSLKRIYLMNLGIKTISDCISNFESIQVLNLRDNEIKSLPESLSNLKSLQRLDLSSNLLTRLPESFYKLENIRYLNLSNNKFETIPLEIWNLKNLNGDYFKEKFKDNPLNEESKELLSKGIETIFEYCRNYSHCHLYRYFRSMRYL